MTDITIIVRALGGSIFEARLEGYRHPLCRSITPLLTSARALAAYAVHDPKAMIYMRHEGSDAWACRGRIKDLAMIAVVERKGREPRFEPWAPRPYGINGETNERPLVRGHFEAGTGNTGEAGTTEPII